MSSSLQEELGVATTGDSWKVGDFKLWPSTEPGVILFTPCRPRLAVNPESGRYQFALSMFRKREMGTDEVVNGVTQFTITSTVQYEAQRFDQLKEEWRQVISEAGYSDSNEFRFVPLPKRYTEVQVAISPDVGTVKDPAGETGVAGTDGPMSFLIELTPEAAEAWSQAIKTRREIPGLVRLTYEYPRMLPDVRARIRLQGSQVYSRLFTLLNVDGDGWLYGTRAEIEAAWEELVQKKAVDVKLLDTLPPELDDLAQNLMDTFADQALQQLFNTLFLARPDPGDIWNAETGAIYVFRWKKWSDATDLELEIAFGGWNWVKESIDTDLTTLFAPVDQSYINEVYLETSFPVTITVHGHEMLESVSVSWSASEGRPPEARVFGPEGGTAEYVLVSTDPGKVSIRYNAKVNYVPSQWPIIEASGTKTVAEGGNRIVLSPPNWIGRLMIYVYIREGDRIKPPGDLDEDDHLVVNVIYRGPNLRIPICDSARIRPGAGVEFRVPLDPQGRPGEATLGAFGSIGGQVMRTQEQPISFDEEAVFILVDQDGIKVVSQASAVPETDRLAQRLLEGRARPAIDDYFEGSRQ